MFEAYFDDSGTHPGAPVAVAACYVSTKRGWQTFVEQWDQARAEEGFDEFHMVDFAAAHDKSKKPFCDWNREKRVRVYDRLARIVNDNKRVGFGAAIPKEPFDKLIPSLPEAVRVKFGSNHYTYAMRTILLMIANWRRESLIKHPMQYFFDYTTDRKLRAEIAILWEHDEERERWGHYFGIERKNGYSFEDKGCFKPLQASDILAWQLNSHMRNVILKGKDDGRDMHRNFRIVRENQPVDLGFITEQQLRNNINHEIAVTQGRASSSYGILRLP